MEKRKFVEELIYRRRKKAECNKENCKEKTTLTNIFQREVLNINDHLP